jgi:exodeoxyribonuclease-3
MRFASWNVNGIRACSKNGLAAWFKQQDFDIVGLQEVRALPEQIPEDVQSLPHYKYWCAAQKKGYSGVGILSRTPALKMSSGLGVEEFDVEGRVITGEWKDCFFLSVYFPNSQEGGARLAYKLRFCEALAEFAERLRKSGKAVIVSGDYNIAHEEIDLARPDDNHESAGFLPKEREWMGQFLNAGWVDTFRHLYPDATEKYTWWSARMRARERNVGWRIDYLCVDDDHKEQIQSAGMQMSVLGSDHCPAILELSL